MDIKVEDIEPQLGVSLRSLYALAVDTYPRAYKLVIRYQGSPHPQQYNQEDALECSSEPAEDRRELPSDMHELTALFQQARKQPGNFPPELGTLVQAQASGLTLSHALMVSGHPGYKVY